MGFKKKTTKKNCLALKIATFQHKDGKQRCNYLHGIVQSAGKVLLFVFQALDWSGRKTYICVIYSVADSGKSTVTQTHSKHS